jgi:hypothetical protein
LAAQPGEVDAVASASATEESNAFRRRMQDEFLKSSSARPKSPDRSGMQQRKAARALRGLPARTSRGR